MSSLSIVKQKLRQVWQLVSQVPILSRFFWRMAVVSFSICVTTAHLVLLTVLQRAENSWAFADWLINYSSGFTRRGFLGAILVELEEAHLASIATSALVLQGVAVLVAGVFWAYLFWGRQPTLVHLAALIFPLGLLFPIADLAAGGRKDLLWFGLLFLAFAFLRRRHSALGIIYVAVLFPVVVLIHEGFFFLAGFLLALLRINGISFKSAVLALVPSMTVFAGVISFSNPSAGEMCQSLISRGFSANICNGAIAFLDNSTSEALEFNLAYFGQVEFVAHGLFMVVCVITMCSVLIATVDKSHRIGKHALLAVVVASPLFALGVDWGRWLCLLYISVLVLVFAGSDADKLDQRSREVSPVILTDVRRVTFLLLTFSIMVIPVAVVPSDNLGLVETVLNFLTVIGN